jgi:hypothetical protein
MALDATGIANKAFALWTIVFVVLGALAHPARARDIECAPPLDPFHQAMCSDPALRPLLTTGERRMETLVDRLSPALRQQLIVGQRKWEATIVDQCGVTKSSPPLLAASARVCLFEANLSRLAWLASYTANPRNGPPSQESLSIPKPATDGTDAPRSPAVAQPVPAPPPSIPPSPAAEPSASETPNASRTTGTTSPLMWVFEIVAVLVSIEILVRLWRWRTGARERSPRAENRHREIDSICGYFNDVNRLRRLPECDVPVPLAPGEFGVTACQAQRWKLQWHRATAGEGTRPAPNWPPKGLTPEYKQLDPVASGVLVITNRQIVFESENNAFRCPHDALLKVRYDRTHLHVFSRQQPSAAIFSTARAELMTLLIDGFARRCFPDGRLPDGKTVSVQRNQHDRLVLMADQAAPLQAELQGLTAKGAA